MRSGLFMTEFNFISFNDVHISDTNPRARLDNYKETILGKILQAKEACIRVRADAALIAGDLFNLKNPTKNSHRLNQELIKVFSQFPCPIYMIEGNHDLTANRLESLEEQPLGVLFADKTLRQLRHEILEKNGSKVSLVGIPYTEDMDIGALNIPENKGYVSQICLMHTHAGLKSGMIFGDRLWGYDELAKLFPDVFVIGHYHIDQGTYELDGKHFVNIGSMCRGSLSEDNIEHHPQIGHIKITADEVGTRYDVEAIELQIRPASEVFDLVKKQEEKKESEDIKLFVDKLATEVANDSSIKTEDLTEKINVMDLSQAVKDRANHYLQEARLSKK